MPIGVAFGGTCCWWYSLWFSWIAGRIFVVGGQLKGFVSSTMVKLVAMALLFHMGQESWPSEREKMRYCRSCDFMDAGHIWRLFSPGWLARRLLLLATGRHSWVVGRKGRFWSVYWLALGLGFVLQWCDLAETDGNLPLPYGNDDVEFEFFFSLLFGCCSCWREGL